MMMFQGQYRASFPEFHRSLTARPTLPVSKSSTKPAPRHSAKIQSNRSPLNCFHLRVLLGRTPVNSRRYFFALVAGSSAAIPPSHRSRSRYKGISLYFDFMIRESMWERADVNNFRYCPMLGRDSVSCSPSRENRSDPWSESFSDCWLLRLKPPRPPAS